MAFFIFGGSNSIFRDGWTAVFSELIGQPVQNRSVGATTTLTGLFRFMATEGDSTPGPGDCVIWEYAVNEVNHVQRDYRLGMLMKNVEHFIILCRQRGCAFLPLVMTPKRQEQAQRRHPYYDMLADLFAAYGISAFDVSTVWRRQTGVSRMPIALYQDNSHYARQPEMMSFIANGIAELAHRACIPADIAPLYTAGTELSLVPLPSQGLHRNSLMQVPAVRLPQRIDLNGHGRIAAICALLQSDAECGVRVQLFKNKDEMQKMRFSAVNSTAKRIILKAVSLENALGPRWKDGWRFGPGDRLRLSASVKPGRYHAEYGVRRLLKEPDPKARIQISGILLELDPSNGSDRMMVTTVTDGTGDLAP
ncbi:hypothetical protein [Paracoccus sp. (in: a-proteobacteria)]|uniref:hypothetical protein n=1 Tax=Paracoccus sp. TaxID=267 RepID=UPI00405A145D